MSPRWRILLITALAVTTVWSHDLVVGTQVTGIGIHALDGDSLRVRINAADVEVRLWGIDAPEHRQPWADEARQALATLTVERTLRIQVVDIDHFKRPIVRVYLGTIEVNQRLILAGWAWWFRRFASTEKSYSEAEQQARTARRGLWRDANPEPPWLYRDRQAAAP